MAKCWYCPQRNCIPRLRQVGMNSPRSPLRHSPHAPLACSTGSLTTRDGAPSRGTLARAPRGHRRVRSVGGGARKHHPHPARSSSSFLCWGANGFHHPAFNRLFDVLSFPNAKQWLIRGCLTREVTQPLRTAFTPNAVLCIPCRVRRHIRQTNMYVRLYGCRQLSQHQRCR